MTFHTEKQKAGPFPGTQPAPLCSLSGADTTQPWEVSRARPQGRWEPGRECTATDGYPSAAKPGADRVGKKQGLKQTLPDPIDHSPIGRR